MASMEDNSKSILVVYVDPSCPFAWITYRWLCEVERMGAIELAVRLLSLSVVNENRDLDAWYRRFNDDAWGPARVMRAVTERHGAAAARRFYEAFGTRFHVGLDTADDVDRTAVAADALADAGLPADLIDTAAESSNDVALRELTTAALDTVGLDVGVPVTVIDGNACSGPVMSAIPGGEHALEVYRAVRTLAGQPGFIRMERQRLGALNVA